MTLPQQLLQTISNPTIAYLLLTVGMLGLFLELAHPGAIVPGVAGGISLLLALLAIGSLDVSWAGVLLMGLAFILFLLDLHVPTHGALTVGGIISFALGSFMLSDSLNGPASGISRFAIVSVTVVISAFFVFAVGAVVRTRLQRSTTGKEAMPGTTGVARTALDPEGYVFASGELWHAHSLSGDVPVGTVVRIIDVEGLTIAVEPADGIDDRAGSEYMLTMSERLSRNRIVSGAAKER
jgi:membrane-bound serine protease (ClpP class)